MMTVPVSSAASSYAKAGKYTVTINGGFIEDEGGNTTGSYTFTEDIGCDANTVVSSSSSSSLGFRHNEFGGNEKE